MSRSHSVRSGYWATSRQSVRAAKVPRRQRPDRAAVPAKPDQAEFRRLEDLAIAQQGIAAADFRKIFDGDAGVERQPLQIGFFVDHAPKDQHPIGADAQFPGARFGSSQQLRRQHPPQAIQFIGRAFIENTALIIVDWIAAGRNLRAEKRAGPSLANLSSGHGPTGPCDVLT